MTIEWMSLFLIFATFLCKNEEKNKLSVTIRYDTIDEINVDSKAEYTA